MRKWMILLVCALFLSVSAFAINADQESKAPDTGAVSVNGKGWQGFSKKEREMYLRGITDVLSACSIAGVVMDSSTMDEETLSFVSSLSNIIPQDFTYGETVDALDKFYSKEENLIIPIAAAYFSVIVERQGWAEPDAIQASVDKLIKYYKGELDLTPEEETPEGTAEEKTAPAALEPKKEEAKVE